IAFTLYDWATRVAAKPLRVPSPFPQGERERKKEIPILMERKLVGEVVPCMLMALMEFCTIGLTILASTVLSKGLSPFVFVVYTNALASIFLLPYNTFIISRNKVTMAQNLAFVGLTYSSPIVAIGMT
ncbi:hypothetical protein M8C21_001528, partial [Ambrosia artemisiifolia]